MKELQEAFLEKYPKNGKVCENFVIATGLPFAWNSLTKPNMAKFVTWLCDNMAQSSARQYCAKLKAVIELYTDEVEMPKDWRRVLTVKDDESQHVYLTEDEIRRVIEYRPDTLTEAIVQQQFVLGCLTGARHSDYIRFTEANVNELGNLVYVSKKTHVKAEIPLSQQAREILYGHDHPYPGAYKQEVSDPTFNATIRHICDMCDIDQTVHLYRRGGFWTGKKYEAVSSHTARRSFVTNLYLRCRDMLLVSKLAGHSNIAMSERYCCCSTEALTRQALDYFNQFN